MTTTPAVDEPILPPLSPWQRWQLTYGANRPLWLAGFALLALLVVFASVKRYGDRRADEAAALAAAMHTDSARVDRAREARRDSAVVQALVTVAKASIDSARQIAAAAVARADNATMLAQLAQQRAQSLSPTVLAQTDPRVIAAMQGLQVALDSTTHALAATTRALARSDSAFTATSAALVAMTKDRDLWRTVADTSAKEIEQLRQIKTPGCGMACWSQRVLVAAVVALGSYEVGKHNKLSSPAMRPAGMVARDSGVAIRFR